MELNINYSERFDTRHIGPNGQDVKEMLEVIGVSSIDQLIDETIPQSIRLKKELNLPTALSETEFIANFRKLTSKNKIFKSLIGMGYYDTVTPPVILRNILENPGWYTAYTPYQAEIAQGRLEALINFQTMVIDLTGMEIANASLLDEGTAAAEAMSMLSAVQKGAKKKAKTFFVDNNVFPQTLDVIRTRAKGFGFKLVVDNVDNINLEDPDLFGVYIQNPGDNGEIKDYTTFIDKAHDNSVLVCVGMDLLSAVLVKSPGEMDADVVIGTTQRFGVPMSFGGPHAAFFATREAYKRQIPGRVIGASIDAEGNTAYRMTLQTREQHIKRERATSNICTAQVLLGVMAGMYAVYHGPKNLKLIAGRIHGLTRSVEIALANLGCSQLNSYYFDTLHISLPKDAAVDKVKEVAEQHEVNFRYFEDGTIGIALDETCNIESVRLIVNIFEEVLDKTSQKYTTDEPLVLNWPVEIVRASSFLEHPVFNTHHSEHAMLRYMKYLENKDISLTHSMIALGSCTMKLNGTSEMLPITWPELAALHPFAPVDQTAGYMDMLSTFEEWLSEITGFSGTTLQPNSGAQGEYAGLMVIKAYLESIGEEHRNVTLIPTSAHGTNPASAVMAGTKVVLIACDENGNIDLGDLKEKAEAYKDNLAAFMVTYPSTHGVYEESITEICEIIHQYGGQVYMDGANMNAQVGLTSPANIGADVCHLNLHKTFAIPHGGGGPGIGPICVADHLVPFLPGNPVINTGGKNAITSISSAPWGSAGVVAISYAYVAMMGVKGLKKATEVAILNANYIMERLRGSYEILYTGSQGRCAHEMIVDFREFKTIGIEVEDVAKRLMDYGFHAPTVSFPVPGTLMIEPTESETKEEIDRFCDALLAIKEEINAVKEGRCPVDNNLLKNAPHTTTVVMSDKWNMPYTRNEAAFPLPFVKTNKVWPSVSRIDNAYGDRNLVCSCLPIEAYVEKPELVN